MDNREYGLFNLHEENNCLLILLSDEEISEEKGDEEVVVLYHDSKVIGYRIFNFVRYAKIKYSGIIFLPSPLLVNVINSVLENHSLDTIKFKENSGYIVKLDDNGVRRVFAKEGTFLRDFSISKGKFVTYYELYINSENENELIEIDEDIKEGVDFFKMEEKSND